MPYLTIARQAPRLLIAVVCVVIVALVVGVHSSRSSAVSYDLTESPYASDHILVKFEQGTSEDVISQVEELSNTRTIDKIEFIDVRIVDLPTGLSPMEAVHIYDALPSVEFAEPDFKLFPTQSTGGSCNGGAQTSDYEAGTCDSIEPAPDGPPPSDPTPDETITAPEPELPALTPNDTYFSKLWGLNNEGQSVYDEQTNANVRGVSDADIDAPEAWGIAADNRSSVVAVIDRGVDVNHPDLDENIWVNEDEVPNNNIDDDRNGYVDDVNGWDFVHQDNTVYDGLQDDHGTHVSGIIAAERDNNIGVAGVGWNTEIMPLKFIDTQPDGGDYGLMSDAAKAIEYAVSEGVTISNNSYGCQRPYCEANGERSTLELAIRNADTAGHLVVTAAGNANGSPQPLNIDQTPVDPASLSNPNIISVAATSSKDTKTAYSNYGATSVDLAAPGDNIYSTLPNGSYGYKDGTSMAAAYVSGVASLLQSSFPNLSHRQLKERVLQSVDRKDALVGTSVTEGRLNAASAMGVKTTQISVQADPVIVTYGSTASISGNLESSSGQPIANKRVTLEKRPFGDEKFVSFATVTTKSDGSFSTPSTTERKTEYRARFGGDRATKLGASVSAVSIVQVKPTVTIAVAIGDLKLGKARSIAGYVKPNHPHQTVTLTIDKRNSAWEFRKRLVLDSKSHYLFNFKPASLGVYDISVQYGGDEDHLTSNSVRKTFRVVN